MVRAAVMARGPATAGQKGALRADLSQDGARQGSVWAPGPSLSFRLPALVVWLSFGLRGPGAAVSGERLKRGLLCSK